ncbi:MAG TPA: hypothetical protein VFH61_17660 [Thermoleophilia bacterium]|nr:hypothetical protein [Thermoleophilia bacterium]
MTGLCEVPPIVLVYSTGPTLCDNLDEAVDVVLDVGQMPDYAIEAAREPVRIDDRLDAAVDQAIRELALERRAMNPRRAPV